MVAGMKSILVALVLLAAHVKDKLGDRMAANVRKELARHGHNAATVLHKQDQREIATDWVAAVSQICLEGTLTP
jgi:hypothetical protein